MIREGDRELKSLWLRRFLALPPPARDALRDALLDLRRFALERAHVQWARHKAPMALYWKVVGVYAGHLARELRAAQMAAVDSEVSSIVAQKNPPADAYVMAERATPV